MNLAEIRERDNRVSLSTGTARTIGAAVGVQSLLVEDMQANAAGKVNAGSYEERWVLKCITADLAEVPVPQQWLTIDGTGYLVEAVHDIEGMLDIRMVSRRA